LQTDIGFRKWDRVSKSKFDIGFRYQSIAHHCVLSNTIKKLALPGPV